MPWARSGHTYIAYVLGLLLVIQFFLAGYGIVELGNEGLDAHKSVGHAMEGSALILVVLALLGRIRGPLLYMSIFVLVLTVLQTAWTQADASVLRAVHVFGALAIAMTLREIVGRANAEADRPATPAV